jgi:putative transposase
VFLNAFEIGSEAQSGIGHWISYYNTNRPHSAVSGRTPDETYAIDMTQEKLAA